MLIRILNVNPSYNKYEDDDDEYTEFRILISSRGDMFQAERTDYYSGDEFYTTYDGWADIEDLEAGIKVRDRINKDAPRTWTFAKIEYR